MARKARNTGRKVDGPPVGDYRHHGATRKSDTPPISAW